MKFAVTFLILLVASESLGVSAARRPFDDYRTVAESHRQTGRTGLSAYDQRMAFDDLDVTAVVEWPSFQDVVSDFEFVRDLQFIDHKGLMRRSSWMYPDDGCWLRAELAKQNLEDASLGTRRPDKVFIFGNLEVETDFSRSGSVSWWYHVVPVVRVGEVLYVMDPAIESGEPLTLEQWVLRQAPDVSVVQLALCSADTFSPHGACDGNTAEKRLTVERSQKNYLNFEENRLRNLGFDGLGYLEDTPPWSDEVLPPVLMPALFPPMSKFPNPLN